MATTLVLLWAIALFQAATFSFALTKKMEDPEALAFLLTIPLIILAVLLGGAIYYDIFGKFYEASSRVPDWPIVDKLTLWIINAASLFVLSSAGKLLVGVKRVRERSQTYADADSHARGVFRLWVDAVALLSGIATIASFYFDHFRRLFG
jgi:hypothetical protein